MKNVLVYPYNLETIWLLENQSNLNNIKLRGVLANQIDDISEKTKSMYPEIMFTDKIDSFRDEIDAVLFCNNVQKFELTYYNYIIEWANIYKKQILLGINLWNELNEQKEAILSKNLEIVTPVWEDKFWYADELFENNIPIITIMGMGENCDKFSTLAQFHRIITQKGYKAKAISSNFLGEFYGMTVIPRFLFDNSIDLKSKTILFNHYIYDLVKKEEPEVIIISCPGGIMPINQYESNYFAEATLAISNAVVSDVGILNTYYNPLLNNSKMLSSKEKEDFYAGLKEICRNKFNTTITAFGISGQQYTANREERRIEYRFMNLAREDYSGPKYLDYTFMTKEQSEVEKIVDIVLEELQGNVFAI